MIEELLLHHTAQIPVGMAWVFISISPRVVDNISPPPSPEPGFLEELVDGGSLAPLVFTHPVPAV